MTDNTRVPVSHNYTGVFKSPHKKLSERAELQLRVFLCELHDLKKEVQSSRYYLGLFAGVTYGEKRYPSQAVELLKAIDSTIQDIKKIKSPEEMRKVQDHLQTLNVIAQKWRSVVPELNGEKSLPVLAVH